MSAVFADETLATETWRYNHIISTEGNAYTQACLEAERQQPHHQTILPEASKLSCGIYQYENFKGEIQ
jgi:hypothetical protein